MKVISQIEKTIGHPLCWFGLAIQLISLTVFFTLLYSIRFKWIDIVQIGLENGIDKPSPKLGAIMLTLQIAQGVFLSGFVFHFFAFLKNNKNTTTQVDGIA